MNFDLASSPSSLLSEEGAKKDEYALRAFHPSCFPPFVLSTLRAFHLFVRMTR